MTNFPLAFDEISCPNCGFVARADFVDIGVGMQQCGPFGCEACGWVEQTGVATLRNDPHDPPREDFDG